MNTDIPPFIGKEPGKKQWTAAFFRSQMRGAWRRIWFRWPGRNLALQAARVEVLTRKKTSEGYRKNVWHRCALCGTLGKAQHTPKQTKELKAAKAAGLERPPLIPLKVAVDHKVALVPTDGTVLTWDEYLFRLFCGPEDLQVLCSICHKEKTRVENTERRQNVKARNSSV
jgi:5-methylcytosine-specific restriction endonuclease McrA